MTKENHPGHSQYIPNRTNILLLFALKTQQSLKATDGTATNRP